ncbi:hypothetical protein HanXRQr2_Chr11g0516611 [Helianthus annuus]|uniref:Uncharacterized protein n=1 Tax=Helianthus annuus TaxID=4232 RepID=A0A9K3HTW4_HELAN|nr:hypothetical protein HanXRQr2_Chr11g0516611 [Helianthus annuus]
MNKILNLWLPSLSPGSGLPSATGTLGYPAISHYPFAHENG